MTKFTTCQFPGCKLKHYGLSYCSGHYQQFRAGRGMRPLGKKVFPSQVRDERGRKQCADCGTWMSEGQFSPSKYTADGLMSRCRECNVDQSYRNRWGFDRSTLQKMIDAQGGKCLICLDALGTGRDTAIDHDHSCCPNQYTCGKCIRGVLCSPCNRGIGCLRDDPEMLQRAANYLRKS